MATGLVEPTLPKLDAINAHTTFIHSDAPRLFVREIGDWQPIVVLHGGPDFSHAYLLLELDRLADRGRLVYKRDGPSPLTR